ncbi:MAG: hypothetical protein IJ982_03780, partial [Fibrobacter sp.]|nr:hypothetical protein [Fibrobacter sp.]
METIGIVVIVMAAVASLTKIIDVVTTILRVNVHTEINPIGQLGDEGPAVAVGNLCQVDLQDGDAVDSLQGITGAGDRNNG